MDLADRSGQPVLTEELRRWRTISSSVSRPWLRRRGERNFADSAVITQGNLAAVDAILPDPFRQRDRVDPQLGGGLLLFHAWPHQGDRLGTELEGDARATLISLSMRQAAS